ncbi:MAG: putative toxin-antitoxin system toxin component, PIN family [Verrucomicrobiota bacterium]
MRVVFDTNVVVSACFWRGAPLNCLQLWAERQIECAITPHLLAEYEETYEELCLQYPEREPIPWVDLLRASAPMVFPVERATGATPDPFDEMVLECALAAKADVLLSGDKEHLQPLKEFRGIPILSPANFLRRDKF